MPDIQGSLISVPTDLEHAGPYITGVCGELVSELAQLKAQLAPLQDGWTGAAKTYFEDQQTLWNLSADGLFGDTGVLGQIAHSVNITWINYTGAEWANVKTWQH
jgi:uncharacterized protein YukE